MKNQGREVITLFLFLLLLIAGSALNAFSQQGIITTFAGGGPNSSAALSAEVTPVSIAADSSGDIFIAGYNMNQAFRVDP